MKFQQLESGIECRRFRAGGLLLGLYIFILALVQSGALHEWFHTDACKPTHQCAVTMLQSGQVDVPTVDVVVPLPLTVWVCSLPSDRFVAPVARQFLLPNRGPPVSLLSPTVAG